MLWFWTTGPFLKCLMFYLNWYMFCLRVSFSPPLCLNCKVSLSDIETSFFMASQSMLGLFWARSPWCAPCFKAPCTVSVLSLGSQETVPRGLWSEIYLWNFPPLLDLSLIMAFSTEDRAKVRKRMVWTTLPCSSSGFASVSSHCTLSGRASEEIVSSSTPQYLAVFLRLLLPSASLAFTTPFEGRGQESASLDTTLPKLSMAAMGILLKVLVH